jgi:hypothetical protein
MRLRLLCSSSLVAALAGLAACSGATNTELDDFLGNSVLSTSPDPSASATPDDGAGKPDAGGGTTKPPPGGKDAGKDPPPPEDETLCDDGLSLASTSPYDAAKALGLCKKSSSQSGAWGVIEAKWSKPDGTAITSTDSWGLLTKLGSNLAPHGKTMLALSTGTARAPGDSAYQAATNGYDRDYTHGVPNGAPKLSSLCGANDPVPGAAHDGVALVLKIRVPASAKSMSFTHQFFTADTGESVCSQFNDALVVMMEPKPAGSIDGNIVFDGYGDLVGINSTSLLRACTPGTHKGLMFTCPLGTTSLVGTGFDNKAATGWLRTTVAVTGGTEITLKVAIWDSGDGLLDSTVLLDELTFSPQAAGAPKTIPR